MPVRTQRFRIAPNSCGGCAATLEQSIKSFDPGASLEIDLEKGEIVVRSCFDTSMINGAILLAGFEVEHKPAGGEHSSEEPQ